MGGDHDDRAKDTNEFCALIVFSEHSGEQYWFRAWISSCGAVCNLAIAEGVRHLLLRPIFRSGV